MRVLHLIDSGGLYGAEVVILNLIEAQLKMGICPTLLSLGDVGVGSKDIEIEARARGIDCVGLRLSKVLFQKGWNKILEYVNILDSQIIHSHGYKGNIMLGMLPRKIRKIPIITTLHGWTSTRVLTKIWLYEILDTLSIKNFDTVVSVSLNTSKRQIFKILGINPVVINNGIPVLNFQENSMPDHHMKAINICKNKFKLLSVGRLSAEKGFDVLLRAMCSTELQAFDIGLVIVGDGREKKRLLKIAEKENVLERIYFVGYLPEAYRIMPYFDAFVLPSYTEGFPITILEAMQSAIPIVATRVGDVPVILGKGEYGKLVIPGDSIALAAAIKEIFSNEEESRYISKNARKRVLKKYNVEKMAEKYLEQYHRVLSLHFDFAL